MIRFKTFSIQLDESKRSGGQSEENDPKAKVNETETALHLARMHGATAVDYRKPGETASDINKSAKAKLSPERATAVTAHSQSLAQHITDHLRDHHGIDLAKGGKNTKVAWTSQAGDVEKFSGKKDDNNPADIMVKHGDGHAIGFSLKYGKKPGLASPGHERMQSLLKMPKESREKITRARKAVQERVTQELEHTGHISAPTVGAKKKQYKALVAAHENGTATPDQSKALDRAHGATNAIRSNMASRYAQSFNDLGDHKAGHAQKTKFVRSMLNAEKTANPLYHAHVAEKTGKVTIKNPQQQFDNMHSHVKRYYAKHGDENEQGGTTFHIYAETHGGTHHKICSVQMKHNSSVYSSIGASVGAAGAGVEHLGKKPYAGDT